MKFKDGIKEKNIIIKCGSDVFLPFSLIFALYVILTAPVGGGFQGGVLGAAAVLLIYLGYGYDVTRNSINPEILRINEACATTIYALLGFAGLVFGANFCRNVFYANGWLTGFVHDGTIGLMDYAVGYNVMTGVGFLLILMLGFLAPVEEAKKAKKKEEEK